MIKSISSAMSFPLLRTGSIECRAGRFVSSNRVSGVLQIAQTQRLELLQVQKKNFVSSKLWNIWNISASQLRPKLMFCCFCMSVLSLIKMWINSCPIITKTDLCARLSSANKFIPILMSTVNRICHRDLGIHQQENGACLKQMSSCRYCVLLQWCPGWIVY